MSIDKLDDKIFSVWKPSAITSNEIVYKIREKYLLKVGHAGTLDPFAEGVLILCTGKKTKEIKIVQSLNKKYTAEIELGSMTDTLDSEGQIILKREVPKMSKSFLIKKLNKFKGEIMQVPPAFSALRKNNVRLYSLARKDVFLRLKPRKAYIESISLKKMQKSCLVLEIVCKSGTYIRSLARDIGESLGTCAHLKALRRDYIGEYCKNNSYSYEQILNESI